MSTNPFNRDLDQSMRGKFVEVVDSDGTRYHGWLARIHHQRGSVLLHDATDAETGTDYGSVFARVTKTIRVLGPQKQIQYAPVAEIHTSPYYTGDIEPVTNHMRGAYRDGFTGSFPVARPHPDYPGEYELINGHKRIAACRAAGCRLHPVEVVDATDEEARELVALEHPNQSTEESSPNTADSGEIEA